MVIEKFRDKFNQLKSQYNSSGSIFILENWIDLAKEYYLWDILKELKEECKKKDIKRLYNKIKKILKNKPTIDKISCCMIVKNESHELDRILTSIKDQVDEIIITDTGSTDNTKEIAKKYTDKVYDYEWEDSFAKARNYSISKAKHDWVIIFDADEEMIEGNIKKAINSAIKKGYTGVSYKFKDIQNGKVVNENYTQCRAFRKEYAKYDKPIHNQVVGVPFIYRTDEIVIKHYGYDPNAKNRLWRNKQTVKLLKKEIEKGGTGYDYYQLGVSMMMLHNYGNAFDNFKKALEKKKGLTKALTAQIYSYRMQMYIFMEQERRAIEEGNKLLELYPTNPDPFFRFAIFYMKMHIFEKAIKNLEIYFKQVDRCNIKSELHVSHNNEKSIKKAKKVLEDAKSLKEAKCIMQ